MDLEAAGADGSPQAAQKVAPSLRDAPPLPPTPPRERGARGLACDDEAQFEEFAPAVHYRDLPVVVFTDDVGEQRVWHNGTVARGRVQRPGGRPDVAALKPVVMSPAHLGFAIEPYEERYLHYRGVGIVFSRPRRGQFMQPSIDTLLVCHAVGRLFEQSEGRGFARIIDVGAGSGFIGKFAAAHAAGAREVCLVDTDPAAKEYWETPDFGSSNIAGINWIFEAGDACPLLERDPHFDLIISNPPYIPTRAEASDSEGVSHCRGFWEGCGLLVHLMELLAGGKCPPGAHLVVALTSLTLKSKQVCRLLKEAPSKGVKVNVLLEREIGWKAWYAGRGSGPEYLIASEKERTERQQLGDCSYFVGACSPGESREGGRERNNLWGYHWHVAYVIDMYRE